MLYRIIPSSGEKIPAIGLGSWKNFDVSIPSAESESLKKVLNLMNEQDGKLIDSSPMYGRSEQAIGELTNEMGLANEFFYATKVWTTGKEAGIRQMKRSLSGMRRTAIDLMQIHNLLDWRIHLNTLLDWKEKGTIRYTGITHYTSLAYPQLEQIIEKESLDFVQFNYSIGAREAEKKLLPLAKDKSIAVLVNEPLDKGNLFKKVRSTNLPGWAAEYGITNWTGFFLKYILSHPAVTCVIPATSNPSHMMENLKAGEGMMPDEKGRKRMAKYFDSL